MATSELLGQTAFPSYLMENTWAWVDFTFPTPIPVTSGERYTAVIEKGSSARVPLIKGKIYANGDCLEGNVKQNYTIPFKTYVDPSAMLDQAVGENFGQTSKQIDDSQPGAQTFTAGQSGYLDKIALFFTGYSPGEDDLTVKIETTDETGYPVGSRLAKTSMQRPYPGDTGWNEISFSPPPFVEKDKKYAIGVTKIEVHFSYAQLPFNLT